MRIISASQLDRLQHCPASHQMPGTPHSSTASRIGTENHSEIEAGERLEWVKGADKEVAYVIHTHNWTVTRVGPNRARDYSSATLPTDIGVTVDAEYHELDREAVELRDWKTFTRVESPLRNLQIRTQALAASLCYGDRPIIAGLYYLNDREEDVHVFTPFDHIETKQILTKILERIGKLGAPIETGEHCRYCPAFMQCPAQKWEYLDFEEKTNTLDMQKTLADMPDAERQRIYRIAKQTKQKAERVIECAGTMVEQAGGWKLSGGRLLVFEGRIQKRLDATKMAERLLELGEDLETYRKEIVTKPFLQERKDK